MKPVQLRLTAEQERAVHELLRRAYYGEGGAAVFAEIRRETFPGPAGAVLVVGLVERAAAKKIQKILALPEE